MGDQERSGKDSRCCQPRDSPLLWRDFQDANHEQYKAFEAWLTSMNDHQRQHRLGEIDDLFEAAALGELEESSDWKNPIDAIRRDPEIYELRQKAGKQHLRFYHGEPNDHTDLLVKLHKQIKTDKESQDLGISQAVLRYAGGQRSEWKT
ncbi:hypothetical protein [Microbacterium aurum]